MGSTAKRTSANATAKILRGMLVGSPHSPKDGEYGPPVGELGSLASKGKRTKQVQHPSDLEF
jgi:hypothetical protein